MDTFFKMFSESNSEDYGKYTQNGTYKEYDFEPNNPIEVEHKIANFWKKIDESNVKPVKPKKKKHIKERSRDEIEDAVKIEEQMTWLETLIMLRKRGLVKDAKAARNVCKMCEPEDLGKVYADEI